MRLIIFLEFNLSNVYVCVCVREMECLTLSCVSVRLNLGLPLLLAHLSPPHQVRGLFPLHHSCQ